MKLSVKSFNRFPSVISLIQLSILMLYSNVSEILSSILMIKSFPFILCDIFSTGGEI